MEIPLDFYPLGMLAIPCILTCDEADPFVTIAVLMDKGIVVGVDQEISLRRNLDFAIFRIITTVRCLPCDVWEAILTCRCPCRHISSSTTSSVSTSTALSRGKRFSSRPSTRT